MWRGIWGAILICLTAAPAGADDPVPGERFHIRVADLPAPYAEPSIANPPQRVRRPYEAVPAVPEGYTATLFAEGLRHPRELLVLPDGGVLVSQPRTGQLILLRDTDGDGRADRVAPFADGFATPYGLQLVDDSLFLSAADGIWRLPYRVGDDHPAGPPERVTAPGAFGPGSGHWTRNLIHDPVDDRFLVAIGSRGNIAEEPEPRATIQVFDRDGGGQRTLASGLRNPVGLAFNPTTGALFAVVNERDGLGDRLVPDYLTRVEDGAFYGWPYAYLGSNPQPDFAERRPDLVARTRVPEVLFEAHSAPIDVVFYDGDLFPPDVVGDAFVSFRGSWNRGQPTGYMVVRVPFAGGEPLGWYESFATGFRIGGRRQAEVWGRPTGLAVAADGALLVSDDTGGTIWRIGYRE